MSTISGGHEQQKIPLPLGEEPVRFEKREQAWGQIPLAFPLTHLSRVVRTQWSQGDSNS